MITKSFFLTTLGLGAYAYGILTPDQELIQAASRDELTMERLQSLIDQGARGNNIQVLFAAIQQGRPTAVSILLSWSKKNVLLVEPYPISAIDSLLSLVEQQTINITCCQLFIGRRWHSKITEMLWAYKEHLQKNIPNHLVENVVRNLLKNVLAHHPMINSLTTSIVARLRSSQYSNINYPYTDLITVSRQFLRLFEQQEFLRTLRPISTVSTEWATEIAPVYAYKVVNRNSVISQCRLYSQNLDPAHEQLEGLCPVQDPIHKDTVLLEPDIQSYQDYMQLLLGLHFEQELLTQQESGSLTPNDIEIRTEIEHYIQQILGDGISVPHQLCIDVENFIGQDAITEVHFMVPRPLAALIVTLVQCIPPTEAMHFLDLPCNRHICLNQEAILYDVEALKQALRRHKK